MVTSLSIGRSTTIAWWPRAVFAATILLALSAFAKETATLAIHLPKSTTIAPAAVQPVAIVTPAALTAPALVMSSPKPHPSILPSALIDLRTGLASWYGNVLQGHRTASGRRFNMFELTAAHRSLPFGTQVKVTDQRNHRSVIVTITDRGELNADRIIDLSWAAARDLDMVKAGVDPVMLEVLPAKAVLVAEATPSPQP
jgi:rare lipoprotein A